MATRLQKNSARLMLSRYEDELNALFAEQESMKAKKGKKKTINSERGIPEMPWGGLAGYLTNTANQGQQGLDWANAFSFDKGENANAPSIPNSELGILGSRLNYQIPGFDYSLGSENATQLMGDTSKRFTQWPSNKGWLGNNWQGLAGMGSSLLAPAFNIHQGLQKPVEHTASDYYNPSIMKDRRYNVNPELEQNLRSQKTYNRNISQGGATSSGQLFSNYGAGLASRMRADASAYAKKSNIDNQYLGEQAQMDYRLGDQMANVNWKTDMANLQNIAGKQGMLGTGLSQVGQAGQNWALTQGQRERDRGLGKVLGEGLSVSQFMPFLEEMIANYGKKGI